MWLLSCFFSLRNYSGYDVRKKSLQPNNWGDDRGVGKIKSDGW